MPRHFTLAAAAGLAALSIGSAAQALTITGGITQVEVTADLGALGLSAAPFNDAFVTGTSTFNFPITGGTSTSAGATILHDDSGVTLSAGSTEVTVGNFVVDTVLGGISGDVIGGASGLDLFSFSDDDLDFSDGIDIDITATLAGALTSIFSAPDLTGAQFGVASTNPIISPIPLPASVWLLIAGLGGLGIAARRRRDTAAAA